MKKKLKIVGIVAVLLLLVSLVGTAQAGAKVPEVEWNKIVGGTEEMAYSVQQTSDGGYILAGSTGSYTAGSWDFWLLKIDSNGNKEWNKTFGGADVEEATFVQQTSGGGYILAGSTESYGAGSRDAWLVKTNSKGHKVWDKTFGGTGWDEAHSVQQTTDGGYIFAGHKSFYDAPLFWLVKTDSRGHKVWDKTFGEADGQEAYSVQQTSDGGYILTGCIASYDAGLNDAWLVKTDSKGNKVWDKALGGTDGDVAVFVQQTTGGGYILAGGTNSYGTNSNNAWLMKTDFKGNEEWNKTFGGTDDDMAFSVQQTSDGGYILTGYTESYGAGSRDVWLVKTDFKGNEEWNKTFGGTGLDEAYSVQQTSDGGYIFTGWIESQEELGEGNDWVIKLESDTVAPPEKETTPEVPTGEEKGIPGFEVTFAISGLLAVVYILRRRK